MDSSKEWRDAGYLSYEGTQITGIRMVSNLNTIIGIAGILDKICDVSEW